jgi:hypothetical protein
VCKTHYPLSNSYPRQTREIFGRDNCSYVTTSPDRFSVPRNIKNKARVVCCNMSVSWNVILQVNLQINVQLTAINTTTQYKSSLKSLIFGLFYFHSTTCFDLQRSSSGGLYIYIYISLLEYQNGPIFNHIFTNNIMIVISMLRFR